MSDVEALDEDLPEEGFLASSNSVHDRTQFQSKFDFELSGREAKAYEVDLYMFLPHNMGVNAESYPRESFYADLTHLLRVRTPEVARGPEQELRIPDLTAADQYFEARLDLRARRQLEELVIHDVKLFGCLVYTELKKLQGEAANPPTALTFWSRQMMVRLEQVHCELRDYRERYVWRLKEDDSLIPDEVRRAFLLTDEYLSYRLESVLIGMHRGLQPVADQCADLLDQIGALLMGEQAYRNEHVEAAREREKARAETHYYRLGLLKKYVSDVLFLRTVRVQRDYVYRNFVAAFGAALAAFFATLANIQTAQMMTGADDNKLRLLTILVLGVTAYVFKDRIKDLSKDYFNSKVKSWLPDYDVQMFYRFFDERGQASEVHLGDSQEYTRYLPRRSVPADVDYIRDLGHRAELEPERNEVVIHYNKRMLLKPPGELHEHLAQARVRRIHDVLRFDVSRFLAKLDNPQKRLSYFDGEEIVTIEAPKVYHLNLIFRYTVTHYEEEQPVRRQLEVERLRVILNKAGILRIEPVLNRGELGFSENVQRRSRAPAWQGE